MSTDGASGPHVLRRINAAAVLRALRDAAEHTARVSDLVLATGLSRPAVTRALTTLADARLVEFTEGTSAQVGRPAVRARFRAEVGHVVGVDIGPHRVQLLIADLAGTVRAERRVPAPAEPTGPRLVRTVRKTLAGALAEAGLDVGELWAVCVGTPGIVDQDSGSVLLAPSIPGWTGLPMLDELRSWLGCPVRIDNDVNLAVIAERWCGEAGEDLLFVQWGERIGSGMVIGGKPYRGASSAAGELGFLDLVTDIDADAAPVTDGLGAFERVAGAGAILQLAIERCRGTLRTRLRRDGDLAVLFDAARAGDPHALDVVHVVARRFARGLAAQLLILDPERVIVGGGMSRAGDVLFDAVREHLRHLLLVSVDLRISTLHENGVALGAVRAALDGIEHRLSDRF